MSNVVFGKGARGGLLTAAAALGVWLAGAGLAEATPFPPNSMAVGQGPSARITQDEFDGVMDELEFKFRPLFGYHRAVLRVDRLWDSNVVNAFAKREANDVWVLEIHGGLARLKALTPDGFAMALCHEVGHHLGGYPFKGESWVSAEGQSDWYATQVCARALWWNDVAQNATFRTAAPAIVRDKCDAAWAGTEQQNLCYRVLLAGKSLTDALSGAKADFASHDAGQVSTTYLEHPAPQCRLDTYEAGALCTVMPNFDVIAGALEPLGRNSHAAELVSARYSCMPASAWAGAQNYNHQDRPRCWFRNLLD